MKINSILMTLLIVSATLLAVPSCKKTSDCSETNISSSGGDDSHNFGQNCMSCHTSGGTGKGCFNVSGSASNSALTSNLSSGTIKFYTAANGGGTLKYTVAIDAKGNFHTTESNTYTGLYPAITGPSGTTKYMSTAISTGACNSCHGASTTKLWGQ